MIRNLRGLFRLARIGGVVAKAIWNILIKSPQGADLPKAQQKVYDDFRKVMNIKIVFNEAAAPLETKRPTWYLANHTSYGDFIVLGAAAQGTYAGKGEILTWPGVRELARAVNYIGLRRSREFNDQSRAKIINNFNEGYNMMMFPEATIPESEPDRGVVTGDEVYMFHAGLLPIIFGEAGIDKCGTKVKLDKKIADNVCVQAVAIKVIEVEGKKNAHEDPELRKAYTAHDKTGMLAQFWRLLTTKEMTVELTPLPVLEPKNFKDHFALTNEAHRQVASVIAPEQKTVYSAIIPGQDASKRKVQPIAPPPDTVGIIVNKAEKPRGPNRP